MVIIHLCIQVIVSHQILAMRNCNNSNDFKKNYVEGKNSILALEIKTKKHENGKEKEAAERN